MKVDLSYLNNFNSKIQIQDFTNALEQHYRRISQESDQYQESIEIAEGFKTKYLEISDIVQFGNADEYDSNQLKQLKKALEAYIPWRKGPFRFFDIHIDSEWQSQLKYNRLKPHLPELNDKTVFDMGCNNAYYMYRLLELNPKLVLGVDLIAKYKYGFEMMQAIHKVENLFLEPIGFEALQFFNEFFDIIFCMGILYHHRSPIEILQLCHKSMKKGAKLIIETLGIGSEASVCLFPQGRYAKMRNVWFIPSKSALINWVLRNGFKKPQIIHSERMEVEEQRTTKWAPFDSFAQFLDPGDEGLTIEGYERPHRIYLICEKA